MRGLHTLPVALVAIGGCFITSCQAAPSPPRDPSTPSALASASTPTMPAWLATFEVNQTLQITPPTPIPRPTPSLVPSSLLTQQCAATTEGLPQGALGALVSFADEGLVITDARDGHRIALLATYDGLYPSRSYFSMVSPGSQYFALVEGDYFPREATRSLRIVDASGRDAASPSWRSGWVAVATWIDDRRIGIAVEAATSGTMVAYDPFTHSATPLVPTFSQVRDWDLPPSPEWYDRAEVALYDTSLTRVAYYATDNTSSTFRLWDNEQARALWTSPAVGWAGEPPAWSPDGSKVAFHIWPIWDLQAPSRVDPSFLVIVDSDGGSVQQITFAPALPRGEAQIEPDLISWAPTGDRLALWIWHKPPSGGEGVSTLGILEVQSQRIVDLCIEYKGGSSPVYPVWSPDGRYLAAFDILVDTIQFEAYRLADVGSITGWLAPAR